MKVLVTGATGFLGSQLLRVLLREDNIVAILVREHSNTWRLSDLIDNPNLKIIYGSMQTINSCGDQFRDFAPDVIFHLAWQGGNSSLYQEDPEQVYSNLTGTLDLIRIAGECGVKAWIGMGTAVEYGEYNGIFKETMLPQPTALYGLAKYTTGLLAEKLCAIYNMRFVWVRPFWTYGPYDEKLRLIPYVISSLLKNKKMSLTLGEQKWDYLYVDDAINALYRLAYNSEAKGIFNLGSGTEIRLRDVIEFIRDKIDKEADLGFGEVPYKKGQIMHLQADITKICKNTGWKPQTTINVGLEKTIEWFRENIKFY